MDICILNASIVFRTNNPESSIKNNRQFHLTLINDLLQPLLLSKVSGQCATLQARRPGRDLSRLKGRTRTPASEENALFVPKLRICITKERILKSVSIALNVMNSCVMEPILKPSALW